jgi:hypothetical protein
MNKLLTSGKARSRTGWNKHLRAEGKARANRGTRRLLRIEIARMSLD